MGKELVVVLVRDFFPVLKFFFEMGKNAALIKYLCKIYIFIFYTHTGPLALIVLTCDTGTRNKASHHTVISRWFWEKGKRSDGKLARERENRSLCGVLVAGDLWWCSRLHFSKSDFLGKSLKISRKRAAWKSATEINFTIQLGFPQHLGTWAQRRWKRAHKCNNNQIQSK